MKKHPPIKYEKMIETLELPKDLMLGMPLIYFTGNREILIENHRGVVSYSNDDTVILVKDGQIMIHGKNLIISFYSKDTIKLTGFITKIEFVI